MQEIGICAGDRKRDEPENVSYTIDQRRICGSLHPSVEKVITLSIFITHANDSLSLDIQCDNVHNQ